MSDSCKSVAENSEQISFLRTFLQAKNRSTKILQLNASD
jgi:hypothetical protein